MADREKVIEGLEWIVNLFDNYERHAMDDEEIQSLNDAIALLKAQEPIEPHYTTLKYLVNGTEVIVHHPECPRCIKNGLALWDAEIEKGQAYCKRCGQAVKWND